MVHSQDEPSSYLVQPVQRHTQDTTYPLLLGGPQGDKIRSA